MLTYEQLLAECEMHGFKLVPKDTPKPHKFAVVARFERGLGPEYVNLRTVYAFSINEAQKQADEQAEAHFKTTEGLEEAVIREVRIRPND